MNKSSGIAIAVIAAIFLAAITVIIPAAIRVNKEVDRMVEYEDIAAKAIAAYPKIGEIVVDSIYKLEAYEGDITYAVTDKDDIAEVMSILKGLELTPKYIGPEDETTRTEGAPKDALWLYVYMEDENESWNLIVDDDNMPTDFVIEHYVRKDMGTHLIETKTGYYTKPDKIYSKVKAIMYKGEKIDLNEVSNQELDEPEVTDFAYNPDAIYTAEPLTITDKEGWYTTDIFMTEDKIFFSRVKENPKLHPRRL